MKKRFPGFTVLIERVLRLSCVLGVAALATACGGGQPEDEGADDANTVSVQGTYSAGTRTRVPANNDARTNGIILSEKNNRPVSAQGIVLSEKAHMNAEAAAEAIDADSDE